MARNEERRRALADAGLAVLARDGSRGLTHRSVDTEAGVPAGTCSNYFRSRTELLEGLARRIYERLAPAPADLERHAGRAPGPDLFRDYVHDIVRRLTSEREVTLALFELRLEAARRPEVAEILAAQQRAGFRADVSFNEEAGLPGTAADIALFHYALDGLVLDRLTTPIDPDTPTGEIVDQLVERLLP